jgi:signal transduction histidine kinase/ActR/RegA family two-component response regulator
MTATVDSFALKRFRKEEQRMSARVKIFLAMMFVVAALTAANIGMGLIFMRARPFGDADGDTRVSKNRAAQVLPYPANAMAVLLSLETVIAIAVSGKLVKQFKNTEDRIARLSESVKAAASMSEARSRLIADMRHEMRKPLNSVVRLSRHMLGKEEMPEETRESVEKIHNAGMTLFGVINDILDVSKVESRKFEIMPMEYDVPSLINDILTLNATYIGDRPIRFERHIGGAMPLKLFGDELRIELVCNSLLSNAFKYTAEGKIDLFFDYERGEKNGWLIVRVADTGIGIPPEKAERLFSSDNRVHSKSSGNIEGTCLPITKAIVTMMGGAITAESEYGKGSVFTVRIPQGFVTDTLIEDEIAKNLQQFDYRGNWSADGTKIARVQLPHTRVLVVDDVQANLDVLRELLELYGMKVDCLNSGWQAVQSICEENVFYDAIFMDRMMAGLDGVETVRVIREEIGSDYAKNVPIIVLSANMTNENGGKYLEKGFQAFLSKPIDVYQLDAIVIRWLCDRETGNECPETRQPYELPESCLSLIGYPENWASEGLRS